MKLKEKSAPITFNLTGNLRKRAYDVYEQAGWEFEEYKNFKIEENGSQLSGMFEEFIAAVLRAKRIGKEQKDYDVEVVGNPFHWSIKVEVRSGSKSLNLGPSTTTGTNRYFELFKAFKKLCKEDTKCTSLIIIRLDTDHNELKIYEIPSSLVWGLFKLNVIGQEVEIPTDKVPQFILDGLEKVVKVTKDNKGNPVEKIATGMRNLCLSNKQLEIIFPYEDYKFVVTDRHKMQDETPEECWRKAVERSPKIQPKPCLGVFNIEKLDYNTLYEGYAQFDGKNKS